MLQHQFFSARPEVDLSDLPTFSYSDKLAENESITEKEIRQTLAKMPSDKASERSEITSDFLKLMRDFLVKAITCLAQNCQNWEYFSTAFKIACTVVL